MSIAIVLMIQVLLAAASWRPQLLLFYFNKNDVAVGDVWLYAGYMCNLAIEAKRTSKFICLSTQYNLMLQEMLCNGYE